MLRIRGEQMQVFNNEADHKFCVKIAAQLKKDHPHKVKDVEDSELNRRIHLGLSRAREQGFKTEANLALFISLMFLIGPTFDEHTRVREILADETTPNEMRLNLLVNALSPADWLEVCDFVGDAQTSWMTLKYPYA